MTAGVSAAAVSPPVADNSEAAVVAGTSSSASVALALPAPARKENDAEPGPKRESETTAANASDAQSDASEKPETESADAIDQETEPTETASNDAPSEETSTASDAPDEKTAAAEPVEDAQPVGAEQGEADKAETPGDSVETASTEPVEEEAQDEKPVETAALEPTTVATETAEADEEAPPAEPEAVEIEDATEPSAEAEPVETPAKVEARSNDASVVLEVAPPPEEFLAAAVVPETETVQSAKAEEAQTAEQPEETKVAALTPPDAPVSDTLEAEKAETAESAALDTAPSDDEKAEAEDAAESATASDDEKVENAPAEEETVEDEKVEDEKVTSEDAGDEETTESAAEEKKPEGETAAASDEAAETPAEGEAVAEEAAPPPPPAHPIVAEIRAKLEEPDQYKNVAVSDLEALKAFYGTYEGPPLWVTEIGFTEKARAIMTEIGKADDWGLDAASFELPPEADLLATPNAHADDELQLSITILSYARDAQIGRLSPSGVSKLFDQHPTLRDPKDVLTEMAASDAPDKYLLSLHPQHTQFKRLQETLVRARDSAKATGRDPDSDRNVQLITINMERWRWLPRQLGNYYVWNNVPEFNVRVMKGGQAIYQEKTIVGQYQYATPFFSARMKNIVFHPNWTVPPTIIKEDLAPKLQGPGGGGFFGSSKQAILARYGLSANYKGERINADTVDWNNVNIHAYTFTQEPGPANVLGQFKFNFPNKHAIYMHDTPQRELFAETTRTLSHGCIRVNQPNRLAALLLSEDKGWNMGHVQSLVAKGPQSPTVISLNHHIPVHLTYFTAIVDQNGTVNTSGDIYGIDNRMASKLFRNPASFPVPATPAVAEESSSSRTQAQSRRSANGFDSFISGLFGN